MRLKTAKRLESIAPFYVMAILERAKKLAAQGYDVIHMEIGEPDFPTPQTIIDAGIQHIRTGEVKYTPAAGLPELRENIALFYQQRYGVFVSSKRVFITPGASGALLLALSVSLNPDETLLMAAPCYPCNSSFTQLIGGKTKTIAVSAETNFQPTAEQIETHWTPFTKGTLIASPANPTGTLISKNQLGQCIKTCNNLGGYVYSDEIYHGLVYGDEMATALQYSNDVFIINSFSKYFGMTGWRIGWLIVPDEFVDATERLAQNLFIATGTHSQYAALAAFDKATLIELERRRGEFAKRRDFLYESLIGLRFEIPTKPEGAFYIYANCAKITDDSYQFALDLLDAEAVAVTPGKDFNGQDPQHYIRFAYTQPIERMAIAMQRLKRFLNKRSL